MSRTNFHGPKDVRVIEIRLYFDIFVVRIVPGIFISSYNRIIGEVILGLRYNSARNAVYIYIGQYDIYIV